jgi:myosin heavy subunit
LHFDVRYVITGASMRTYLLEKSRVVYQSEGERNYHIFYQMCASRKHHAELGELFLEDADKFNYLGGSRAALAERNIDDSACFRETFEAMNLLGFGIDDRRMFFKVSELYSFSCRKLGLNVSEKIQVLAGVLQLGNVEFVRNSSSDDATIQVYVISQRQRFYFLFPWKPVLF